MRRGGSAGVGGEGGGGFLRLRWVTYHYFLLHLRPSHDDLLVLFLSVFVVNVLFPILEAPGLKTTRFLRDLGFTFGPCGGICL